MQNRTDIINTALLRCGAAGVNIAFQDTQENAIAFAAYERCRKYLLSQHVWNFARKFTLLAQGTEKPAFGYRYSFPLPADCAQVCCARPYAVGEEGEILPQNAFAFPQAKWDVVGRNIVSNFPSLALDYVSTEETDMPEAFANALSWYLAMEIAPYLQQGVNRAEEFYQMFSAALDEAKVENDIEKKPEEVQAWKESPHILHQFSGAGERW